MDLGRACKYNIGIEPSANNGFIVKIGCGRFVAKDREQLIEDLDEFLKAPEKWEKKYNDIYGGDVPQAAPEASALQQASNR